MQEMLAPTTAIKGMKLDDTVALITAEEHTFLSSSTVREIATLGGDVSSMVPPFVDQALRAKVTTLGQQHSPPNALRD